MYDTKNQTLIICKIDDVRTETDTGKRITHWHPTLKTRDVLDYLIDTTQVFVGREETPVGYIKRQSPIFQQIYVTPGQQVPANSVKKMVHEQARHKWFVLRCYPMAITHKGKIGNYYIYQGQLLLNERDIDKVIEKYKVYLQQELNHSDVISKVIDYVNHLNQQFLSKTAKDLHTMIDLSEFSNVDEELEQLHDRDYTLPNPDVFVGDYKCVDMSNTEQYDYYPSIREVYKRVGDDWVFVEVFTDGAEAEMVMQELHRQDLEDAGPC